MSRREVTLAHAVIAIVIGGSVFAAATARECWPFSPYPMYAWVERDRSVSRLQLYGVTGNPPREFALPVLRYLRPFDDARLTSALWRLWYRPDYAEALPTALTYALQRYETQRQRGGHDGPPLFALRLYRIDWDRVDAWARTAGAPDHRLLVMQVPPDG